MSDKKICNICYTKTQQYVTYQCHHECCRPCAIKTILTDERPKCPLDELFIDTIVDGNKEWTVKNYRYNLWYIDEMSTYNYYEFAWSNYIRCQIEYLNLIIAHEKMFFPYNHETRKLQKLRFIEALQFKKDETCLLLLERLRHAEELKYPSSIFQPHDFNILNQFYYIFSDESNFRVCVEYFKSEIKLEETKITEHLNNNMKHIIAFVISYLRSNGNIYRLARPDIKEIDINKCLICCKLIEEMKFATFSHCQHKICLDCIETYTIMHGSCPFHSTEISNFKLSDNKKSILSYFNENYEHVGMKLFKKFMDDNIIPLINQALEIHSNVPNLIRSLIVYQEKSRISGKQNDEISKRLQSGNITDLFLIFNEVNTVDTSRYNRKFELLINIVEKSSSKEYFNILKEIILKVETIIVPSCKRILLSYNDLIRKPFNPLCECLLRRNQFISTYENEIGEIMKFNAETCENVSCADVYGSIKKLQNTMSKEMKIINNYKMNQHVKCNICKNDD